MTAARRARPRAPAGHHTPTGAARARDSAPVPGGPRQKERAGTQAPRGDGTRSTGPLSARPAPGIVTCGGRLFRGRGGPQFCRCRCCASSSFFFFSRFFSPRPAPSAGLHMAGWSLVVRPRWLCARLPRARLPRPAPGTAARTDGRTGGRQACSSRPSQRCTIPVTGPCNPRGTRTAARHSPRARAAARRTRPGPACWI